MLHFGWTSELQQFVPPPFLCFLSMSCPFFFFFTSFSVTLFNLSFFLPKSLPSFCSFFFKDSSCLFLSSSLSFFHPSITFSSSPFYAFFQCHVFFTSFICSLLLLFSLFLFLSSIFFFAYFLSFYRSHKILSFLLFFLF